ncbi:MAG: hypothetical protein U1F68_20375, partial [Gammaproteobacteria bacterium]
MGVAWVDKVKNAGVLSVYLNPTVTSGAWAGVLDAAIREFNTLSKIQTLGVTLSLAKDAPTTDGSGGGADVGVDTADGTVTLDYAGTVDTDTLSAKGLHGLTYQVQVDGLMEKAFV